MPTFSNRDKEILSIASNLVHEKVTALGADGYSFSEPYPNEQVLPLSRTLRFTPDGYNGNDGLISPNYDDYPAEGAVGTRYETVRLHSYIPSGTTGPDSCQTFFTISSAPYSNSIADIDNVRIKPLISPVFSPRKKNAANSDTYIRGFELALYPAKDNGGVLEADTTNGPISPLADPGASESSDSGAGAGHEGFWYVDYDNGIVRFSRPPVNGTYGVMNPNNVFGDINGNTDAYGAITLFATFYEYTGGFGVQENAVVTVGDGYVSSGQFTGAGSNITQAAINSLPDEGGTVFIKEGQYDFTTPVTIPAHVNISGLGGVTIVRPRLEPAFILSDGYSSIEGVEIHGRDGVSNGGAIELRCETASQVIRQVTIKNNVIYAEDDAPGVSFAPLFDCTYIGVDISNNIFKPNTSSPVYIGETDRGGNVSQLTSMVISRNDFQIGDSGTSSAIDFTGGAVLGIIEGLSILDNDAYGSNVNIDTGNDSVRFTVSGNKIYDFSMSTGNIVNCLITQNHITNDFTVNNIVRSTVSGNSLNGNISVGNCEQSIFSDNNLISIESATASFGSMSYCNVSGNIIGITSGATTTIDSVSDTRIIGNFFGGNFTITNAATDLTMSGNEVEGTVVFGSSVTTSAITENNFYSTFTVTTTSTDLRFCENYVADTLTLTGTVTRINMSSNRLDFFLTFGGSVTNSCITNNKVDTDVTANTLSGVVISGNNFNSDLNVTTSVSGGYIVGNSISSNLDLLRILDTLICDNYVSQLIIDSGALPSILNSIISNNWISGRIYIASSSSITMQDSIITGNYTDNNINDNFIANSGTGNVIRHSIISNNFFTSDLKIGLDITTTESRTIMEDCIISGNTMDLFQCSSASRDDSTDTYLRSVIINNVSYSNNFFMYGKSSECNITNNYIGVSLATGDLEYSAISNNVIISTATINALDFSTFSGNRATGNMTVTSDINDSIISDNVLDADLTVSGTLQDSVISNNVITGTFSADTIINTSSVGNNVGTNNSLQSISLHIPDGYVTCEHNAYLNIGTNLVATAQSGNTNGISGIASGSGSGLYGAGGTLGVGVVGDGGTTLGVGVVGTGGPGSTGVYALGGSGNSHGLLAQSSGSGRAVWAYAPSTGPAVYAETSLDGNAVTAIAGGNGYGVRGSAAGTSAGVYGGHGGAAPGVQGVNAGTGYGGSFQATTTSPVRSALRIVPQGTAPTIALIGDIYVSTAGVLYICTNATGPVWTVVGTQT